jgi:RNA polymerase sigma-70 factor (ECF subfamily)
MTGEKAAFLSFRSHPAAGTLVDLLRSYQGRVHRLCYQVLHNSHDAEDAAQEALLKIPGEIRRFTDSDSFRRWLNRVSLNAALEVARKAARRRAHEARAAMPKPEPLDAVTRLALFEALTALGEAPRNLLLEHYFEGESMESIGAREGCSAPAVFKRLEGARELLRRRLGGAGAMAVLPNLESLFPPVPVAPDLVTGAVLARVAVVAGGTAMTVKSVVLSLAITSGLILCLAVGLVALNFTAPDSLSRLDLTGRSATTGAPTGETAAGPDRLVTASEASGSPAREPELLRLSPLQVRLQLFKTWWEEMADVLKAAEGSFERYEAWRKRHEKELWERISGMRDLIVAHPEEFMAFLRDPANEGLLMDLTQMNLLMQTDRPYVYFRKPFAEYPRALTQGLFDLLHTGSVRQRVAVFRMLSGFPDVPDEFRNAFFSMIDDPEPEIQGFAIHQVGKTVPMTAALFSKLSALGTVSESYGVRVSVLGAMCLTPGPEAETFFLNRLTTVAEQGELFNIFLILSMRYGNGLPIQVEPLAKALSEFAARSADVRSYWFFQNATYLPGDRLKPILIQLQGNPAYAGSRDRLQKAIEMIDQGKADRGEMMKILDPR